MKQNGKILQSLKKEIENIRQLIITSILLAIGVDSLATGLLVFLGIEQKALILIIVGTVLSCAAIVYFLLTNISNLDKDVKFEGFIIYNNDTKELLPVSRYDISEDMVWYLNAACVENKALKTLWYSEPINNFKIVGGKPGQRALAISTHSGALLIELIEYCVIEQLSLHLSEYFNNSNLKATEELSRKDIPDILLENRFLKLFSEDMQSRELFVKSLEKERPKDGRVVAAYHPSGAIYKEFDLVLPANSKVKRINKNQIVIETNMFTLSICCLFGGFSTVFPRGFKKDYLKIQDNHKIHTYQFNIEISIKFKIRSFFLSNKWNYYMWADDFVERIGNYMSKDIYFTKINWETVSTLLRCQSILLINSKESKEHEQNSK